MKPIPENWHSDAKTGRMAEPFRGGRDGGASTSAREHLSVRVSTSEKHVNQEDVLLVREGVTFAKGGPAWSLYCVCDGHAGVGAARYVKDNLCRVLASLLPGSARPEYGSTDFEPFTYDVGTALIEAFVRLGQNFLDDNIGDKSGSTVTVALLCGRLLTVGNVGDSYAVVDTGTDTFVATAFHRIEDNEGERERLKRQGVQLGRMAPKSTRMAGPGERGVGPLRCFPGGLTVSRSIGDAEAGEHVLSCPHVYQVILPKSGARILMGSCGLWDLVPWERAVQLVRRTPISKAAPKVLAHAIQQTMSLTDDATVLVLDVLPSGRGDFPNLVKEKSKRKRENHAAAGGCGGLAACLGMGGKSKAIDVEQWDKDVHELLAAIDGWELLKDAVELSPTDSCSSLNQITSGKKCDTSTMEERLCVAGFDGYKVRTPSLSGSWRKLSGGVYAEIVEPDQKPSEKKPLPSIMDPADNIRESCEWLMSFAQNHAGMHAVGSGSSDVGALDYQPESQLMRMKAQAEGSQVGEASLQQWMKSNPMRTSERIARLTSSSRRK